MRNNYYKTLSVSFLLVVVFVSAFAGCTTSSSPTGNANQTFNQNASSNSNIQVNQSAKSAASFINKVWKVDKSSGVAPGQIYVFLSDGTLVMTSPQNKPAFGSWANKDGALTMTEEGIIYKVDTLKLNETEFDIKINNPGKPVEIEFVQATESEAVK